MRAIEKIDQDLAALERKVGRKTGKTVIIQIPAVPPQKNAGAITIEEGLVIDYKPPS
jgi:hypothetical protein